MSTSDFATSAEAFTARLLSSFLGGMDMVSIYVGDRLGLYAALAIGDPRTPRELADATGVHERYAREWLEQQALAGILRTDDESAPDDERRYSLPPEYREVLLDERSLEFMAPLAQGLVACTLPVHRLLDAYRSGEGIPFGDYGSDLHEAQARFTRPMFEQLLARRWIGAVPALRERLEADPPARVADVACGLGHSSIAIAQGYPKVTVDGIDLDDASIARAGELLPGSGVEDRVTFQVRDAADPGLAGRYTSRSSSRRCTTCRARSTCCARSEVYSPTAARSSSATSAPPTASRSTRATWSGCCTRSASPTACRPA